MVRNSVLLRSAFVAAVAFSAVSTLSRSAEIPVDAKKAATGEFTLPRGLEDLMLPIPVDNLMTPGKIRIGEMLFFDTRLSKNAGLSCASCHDPDRGWTDGRRFSPRFDGTLNTRNTPTLLGVGFAERLSWDGRSDGLESQVVDAWVKQMGADPEDVARKLGALKGYRAAFKEEFGGAPSAKRIVRSLATFLRSIQEGDTAWDRSEQNRTFFETDPIGRGYKLFVGQARCARCHLPPLYSDTMFHRIGIGPDQNPPDLGRGGDLLKDAAHGGRPSTTVAEELIGAFRTPSLRGLLATGPFFHDGRTTEWRDAVAVMIAGGDPNHPRDQKLEAVRLTADQKRDLLAFIESLTPEPRPYRRPALP